MTMRTQPLLQDIGQKTKEMDWSKLPLEDLNGYGGSLCFFDAEGMRFHLPAFLIADVEGTLTTDILFHLAHYMGPDALSRFNLLSELQRRPCENTFCFVSPGRGTRKTISFIQ